MVVWRRAAGFGLARLFARPAAARLLHLRDLIHHAAACSAPPEAGRGVQPVSMIFIALLSPAASGWSSSSYCLRPGAKARCRRCEERPNMLGPATARLNLHACHCQGLAQVLRSETRNDVLPSHGGSHIDAWCEVAAWAMLCGALCRARVAPDPPQKTPYGLRCSCWAVSASICMWLYSITRRSSKCLRACFCGDGMPHV